MAELRVRLTPRAHREDFGPERDGALVVRVTAPPVGGQANLALCRLLAKRAGVQRGAVTVLRGESSRDKIVRIDGISDEALRARLGLSTSA
jgi:uncharacterized protein